MDLTNLEKLKVAELRNELQIRGLDTKGVKTVLIKRLRCFLEDGNVSDPPSRRTRRTRSSTRSPSPTLGKKPRVRIKALDLNRVTEEVTKEGVEYNEKSELLNFEEHVTQNAHSSAEEEEKGVMSSCEISKEQNVDGNNTPEKEGTMHLTLDKLNEASDTDETAAVIENVTNQTEDDGGNCQNAINEQTGNPMDIVQKEVCGELTTTKVDDYAGDMNINEQTSNPMDIVQKEVCGELITTKVDDYAGDMNMNEQTGNPMDSVQKEVCGELTTTKVDDCVEDMNMDTNVTDSIKKTETDNEKNYQKDDNKKEQHEGNVEISSSDLEVVSTHNNNDDDRLGPFVDDCLATINEIPTNVDNSQTKNQCESEAFACTMPCRSNSQSNCSEKTFHENNELDSLTHVSYIVTNNDKNNIVQDIQQVQNTTEECRVEEKKLNEEENQKTMHESVCSDDNGKKTSSNSLKKEFQVRKRSHSNTSITSSHQYQSRSRTRSRCQSRSRSRSRSIKHGSSTRYDDSSVKNKNDDDAELAAPEDEPVIEECQFGLSWLDSDLHLRIDPVTFTSARPMNHDIYALIWSGARSNYGVREGKVCFEVRISDESVLGRSHEFRDEPHVHGFRIGFSVLSTSLLLGEAEKSYAYCESGKKATKGEFTAYGPSYGLYDVIGCYLDLDSEPCSIQYTLNGKELGVAFQFDKSVLGEAKNTALFPHILTKGYEYQVNFADNDNLLLNVERKGRKRKKSNKEGKELETKGNVDSKTDANEEAKVNSKGILNSESEKVQRSTEKAEAFAKIDGGEEKGKIEVSEHLVNKSKVKDITTATTMSMQTSNEESLSQPKQAEEERMIFSENNNDKEHNGEEKCLNNVAVIVDNTGDKQCESHKDVDKDNLLLNKRKKWECLTIQTINTNSNEHGGHDNYDHSDITNDDIKPTTTSESVSETTFKAKPSLTLLPNYELIALIPEDKYVMGPQRPESRKDCEVILMIGLPGSGKTTWVQKHNADNIEKRYNVIGADALIDKMTVDGIARKSIHKGRFDRVYELCFNIIPSLEGIAVKRRRNYILDQTNAYASTQRRKMKGFSNFKRIAVVCLPKDDELKRRLAAKKDKGHHTYAMKESTFSNTQANFSLPSLEFGWFDEIIYTDLSGDEAKKEVKAINKMGKRNIEPTSSGSGSGSASGSNGARGSDRNGNANKRTQHVYNRREYNHRSHDDYNRRYDHDNRWSNNRRSGGHNMNTNFNNYSHYGSGSGCGGAGGGMGVYRNVKNRNYNQRFMGGPQNWTLNNTRNNRYDDYRNNRTGNSTGSGNRMGNRYNAYNNNGNTRSSHNVGDYRERDNRDRSRNNAYGGGNSVSGTSGTSVTASGRHNYEHRSSHRQPDFRIGHRDTRVDNRGGSALMNTEASKYNPFSNAKAHASSGLPTTVVDSYNNSNSSSYNSNKQNVTNAYAPTTDNAKWDAYHEQQQQMLQYNQQYHPAQEPNNWQMYDQQMGVHQHPNQQQGQWDYNVADYGQWQSTNQQHQWMAWWQQQQEQMGDPTQMSNSTNQQYWSQYSYDSTTAATSTTQQQQQASTVDSDNPSSSCMTMGDNTAAKK